jgi:hypothetical protein
VPRPPSPTVVTEGRHDERDDDLQFGIYRDGDNDLDRIQSPVIDQYEAQRNGAKTTWVDLVDHGGGDGGGLQTRHGIMASDDIAGAISGVTMHAKAHPEDAGRGIDGVVANQCQTAL